MPTTVKVTSERTHARDKDRTQTDTDPPARPPARPRFQILLEKEKSTSTIFLTDTTRKVPGSCRD